MDRKKVDIKDGHKNVLKGASLIGQHGRPPISVVDSGKDGKIIAHQAISITKRVTPGFKEIEALENRRRSGKTFLSRRDHAVLSLRGT